MPEEYPGYDPTKEYPDEAFLRLFLTTEELARRAANRLPPLDYEGKNSSGEGQRFIDLFNAQIRAGLRPYAKFDGQNLPIGQVVSQPPRVITDGKEIRPTPGLFSGSLQDVISQAGGVVAESVQAQGQYDTLRAVGDYLKTFTLQQVIDYNPQLDADPGTLLFQYLSAYRKAIIEDAVREGILQSNPLIPVAPPPRATGEPRPALPTPGLPGIVNPTTPGTRGPTGNGPPTGIYTPGSVSPVGPADAILGGVIGGSTSNASGAPLGTPQQPVPVRDQGGQVIPPGPFPDELFRANPADP